MKQIGQKWLNADDQKPEAPMTDAEALALYVIAVDLEVELEQMAPAWRADVVCEMRAVVAGADIFWQDPDTGAMHLMYSPSQLRKIRQAWSNKA